MACNLGWPERVLRGGLGVVALGVGLFVGRLAWWGLLLDVVGALLLLSAWTGFCHVRKAVTSVLARTRDGRSR